ncbi:hypothetical protein V2I01_08085 [Micromonospora sp. BRA006-A]|nr:hypothetical protein [Micromonospora sp. BRA006-A]
MTGRAPRVPRPRDARSGAGATGARHGDGDDLSRWRGRATDPDADRSRAEDSSPEAVTGCAPAAGCCCAGCCAAPAGARAGGGAAAGAERRRDVRAVPGHARHRQGHRAAAGR